jgi:predicted ATP-binding protein involved in virulence
MSDNSDDGELLFKYNNTHYQNIQLSIPMAFRLVIESLDVENPLFAAYMAGHFINENDSVLRNNIISPSEYAAYENSFNRTIDFTSTISWFDKADADEARTMRDSGTKDELPELAAVREALSKALLGQYERPRMIGNPPELIVYQKETQQAYKVSQLSDGYRSMLALVMDLARRMAQSGSEANTKSTEGSFLKKSAIVLIDEVELHLHPSWQQTVLTTLMDIFPNTQFIVTTHSPQILTSIPPKHIRILNDGKAYTYSEQTQGVEASRLLKRVFGVDPRPVNLDIVKALNEYRDLVYTERWDTPRAQELKHILDDHFGNDDIELMDMEVHVENSKWENTL